MNTPLFLQPEPSTGPTGGSGVMNTPLALQVRRQGILLLSCWSTLAQNRTPAFPNWSTKFWATITMLSPFHPFYAADFYTISSDSIKAYTVSLAHNSTAI